MYLLRNSNFNFSYLLHVIREFLACILDTIMHFIGRVTMLIFYIYVSIFLKMYHFKISMWLCYYNYMLLYITWLLINGYIQNYIIYMYSYSLYICVCILCKIRKINLTKILNNYSYVQEQN